MEQWVRAMKAKYPCVHKTIGPESHQDKELKIIGRTVRVTADGVEVEVDPKYLASAAEAYGLQGCKAVATPGAKEEDTDHTGRRELLRKRLLDDEIGMTIKDEEAEDRVRGEAVSEEEAVKFRSISALLNFIAPDRPEILFSVKEILRAASKPGTHDVQRLKRIVRFMIGHPEAKIAMPWSGDRREIVTYVDADFAGCRATRKSTCGGCILWGGGLVKAWSKTLPTLALSTAEAELGVVVRGATEAEGIASILRDFGMTGNMCLRSDASVAIGIVQRTGVGRVRHLAVADLWIQQKIRRGDMVIEKVPGEGNPSDLMTKCLDRTRLHKLLLLMGIRMSMQTGSQESEADKQPKTLWRAWGSIGGTALD